MEPDTSRREEKVEFIGVETVRPTANTTLGNYLQCFGGKRRSRLAILIIFILIATTSILIIHQSNAKLINIDPQNQNQNQTKADGTSDTIQTESSNRIAGEKPCASPGDMRRLFNSGTQTPDYNWITNSEIKDGSYIKKIGSVFKLAHIDSPILKDLADISLIADQHGNHLLPSDYSFSNDLKFILLTTDRVKGWRHSYTANYWIYNIDNKSISSLPSHAFIPGIKENKKINDSISLTMWSPNGHNIAWVQGNNLFANINDKNYQITSDGSPEVMNGIADWVYEEEVFNQPKASFFSPDSSSIAFIKFNDTLVKTYEIMYFAKYGQDQYPKSVDLKYPKSGSPNPVVTLHIAQVAHLDNHKIDGGNHSADVMDVIEIDFGAHAFSDDDRLITQIVWLGNTTLTARLMNRIQNRQRLFILEYTNSSWSVTLARDERTIDGAWHNKLQPMYEISIASLNQNPGYLELAEDQDGFTHIAYFWNASSPTPFIWLTRGSWVVTLINGFDPQTSTIFYTSTEFGSTQRHIYSIKLNGTGKLLLSKPWVQDEFIGSKIDIFDSSGLNQTNPAFFSARFSPGNRYYILAYQGPSIPYERIERVGDSEFGYPLNEHESEQAFHRSYTTPITKYQTIKNDVSDEMNMQMILPPNFNASSSKTYPVLMEVYNGPDSQLVSMSYNPDFMFEIATLGIIVVIVDGRGTGYKGRKFRSAVYKQLGRFEVDDQITAARWLKLQPYIKGDSIAIWGWSYGGFMVAKIAEYDSRLFVACIAVAPVTDMRYYDTIYTERYMQTPALNAIGYATSAITKMEGFKHTKFLLVHGTADGI